MMKDYGMKQFNMNDVLELCYQFSSYSDFTPIFNEITAELNKNGLSITRPTVQKKLKLLCT